MLCDMNEPRTILLAVDLLPDGSLTEGCRSAADAALQIAKAVGARTILAHSTKPVEYWSPLKRGLVVVSEGITPAGRAAIDAVADEFRAAGSDCDVTFSDDRPYLLIAREAQRAQADLVVIGKHNKAEKDGSKLGNVAKRILHYCPCRVLAVQAGAKLPVARILAATDLTPVGGEAIDSAAWLAVRHEADLHVVHAYRLSMEHQIDPTGGDEQHHQEVRTAAAQAIAEQLAGTGFEERAEVHIGFGSPSQVLLEAVERLKPGLVVMGTISRGGIAGFLTGNTAEHMLDRIPASILAVKPADFESPVKL